MEFRDYLRVLRRGWILIVVVAAVGVGLAFAYLTVAPRTFVSTSVVLVTTQGSETVSELQLGNQFSTSVVATYAQVAESPAVLNPVITRLDLPLTAADLASVVSVNVVTGTTLLDITATNSDPALAARISNAVAESTISVVGNLDTPQSSAPSLIKLQQIQDATVPTSAVSPNRQNILVLGLIVGLILGVAATAVIYALDRRIHSARELALVTERPVLSRIPFRRAFRRQPIVVRDEPASRTGEAYRTLRTNLRFLESSSARSFVVTSAVSGEGKSSVAVNLAWALADAHNSVVLVDADLRKPQIATLLELPESSGLSDLLVGRVGLNDVMRPSGHELISVITAGSFVPNPSEVLGSNEMGEVLKYLETRFDYVIFDTPPALSFTDAAVVSAYSAGTILVVAAGSTKREQFSSALMSLSNVGVVPVGVVLNKMRDLRLDSNWYARPTDLAQRVDSSEVASSFDEPQYRRGKRALDVLNTRAD